MILIFDLIQQSARFLAVAGTLYLLFLSLTNVIWLRLSARKPSIVDGSRVSVLVPAHIKKKISPVAWTRSWLKRTQTTPSPFLTISPPTLRGGSFPTMRPDTRAG